MHLREVSEQSEEKRNFIDKFLEVLVFLAICFTPFQLALTIDIGGSPLKISEILIVISLLFFPFSSYFKRAARGQVALGIFFTIFLIFGIYFYFSVSQSLPSLIRGYDRSETGDIIFYLAFGVFSLIAWKLIASFNRELIQNALIVAAWLLVLAVLLQQIGIILGQQSLLESLGFETVGKVEDQIVSTRNGPFKEGQHLGFYSGALLIVCLFKKRWIVSIGLLYSIYYSQSTTAILGLLLALGVVVILRLNLYTISVLLGTAIAAFLSFIFSPSIREFVTFQLAKLGLLDASSITDETVSLNIRSLKSMIGFNIMWEHPFTGVGPGRYSVWFFKDPLSLQMPSYYFHSDHRPIAENIYSQIAAETGLFGFVALIFFIIVLFVKAIKRNEIILIAILAFVALGISTQSMWTFLPIWTIFAFAASEPKTTKNLTYKNEKN